MTEPTLTPPSGGAKITISQGRLNVPDQPIIPFIEGDGTGPDIWRASVRVFDAAVEKVYKGKRKIHWMEVFAGEKAFKQFNNWLPESTVQACRDYLVSIKGPLTTPVGGGIRSLNVALRQMLDLYVCLRPVRWFKGVPSPVRDPSKVDMVIFRENTEDIYAGIEYEAGSAAAQKLLDFLKANDPKGFDKIRFGTKEKANEWQKLLEGIGAPHREVGVNVGLGIKPVSYLGTERIVHSAISYAMQTKRKSVTIVHKGNIMKFTEGAFRGWGYEVAEKFFPGQVYTWDQWEKTKAAKGEAEANAEQKAELGERQGAGQGFDRRHHAAAGADASGRIQRHRHAQLERRLLVGCARRAGRRHRHRAGRQHQLPDRPRRVRSDARHRAEVREPRQGESGFGDPVRRNDAALHGLDRSGRRAHHRDGQSHRREKSDL